MRVIVMFDLPIVKEEERREYRIFRKYLVKNGFLMLQESIYTKIAQNSTAAESIVSGIRNNKPKDGLVQVLKITEKQYSKIEYIVGEHITEVINSDERLIVL